MSRRIDFAGIFGWPLDHTLSPTIHNVAFRRLGMDWVYLTFPVPPEGLGDAISGLRALGGRGANVTMPHKERVVEYLDELSEDAERLGAVNTIRSFGGRLIGHNTDVDGFRSFLEDDAGFSAAGRSALIVGAGGAARAVGKALSDAGAGSITVCSRTLERAEGVAALTPAASAIEIEDATSAAGDADLIVNATPLGMDGEDLLPEVSFRPGQLVVDLVYDPPTTPLLDRARAAGADAWSGLGMLVHQAAASFEIWTGRQAPLEAMSAAAVHALGLTRRGVEADGE